MAPIPESFDLVPLTRDRLPDVLELDMWAFPTGDSIEDMLAVPSPLSWDRTFGVVEADHPERLVALHASYPFSSCPVPGGRVRAAGLTWVGVHPQWRRRGLLSAMIDAHFAHCREWGEPVSLLTASEPAIYGRFGYGLATRRLHLTMKRGAALRPVKGAEQVSVRFETASIARHGGLVGRLHAAVDRPGWVTRETPQLATMWLTDAPVFRAGREVERIAVAERGGETVGYALFRRKSTWGDAGPEGTVGVQEVVATDPAVAHALWSRLLDLDLMTEVTSGMLADDDPLLSLLVDLRAARVTVKDNVWCRIIDLPAALAARQYQAGLDVVLDVRDARLPDNTGHWRVTAEAFRGGRVARTDAEADLALDIRELGAAYLGGTTLVELAGAGLV
ncbi:MAG TPA: GNAT family N-acetyltransferase, partial [Propionicimonas sp.]|uniref:GNAT family N-acetyltransferase n=1 Tax=Propionicimonas sp. TaxID=1955623 RepID=UPI002F40A1DC